MKITRHRHCQSLLFGSPSDIYSVLLNLLLPLDMTPGKIILSKVSIVLKFTEQITCSEQKEQIC